MIEILQGDQPTAELSSIYGINTNMLNRWKQEALEGLPQVFERSGKKIKQEQSRQQALLLAVNRSSLYYQPAKPLLQDLEYKAAIDRIYTKSPFFGSCRIALALSEKTESSLGNR